jgi:hypothetical protein
MSTAAEIDFVAPGPNGLRELIRLAVRRAEDAHDKAEMVHARQATHEATDALVHEQLKGDVREIRREIKHATWALIVGLASLIGTVIAKGHLF